MAWFNNVSNAVMIIIGLLSTGGLIALVRKLIKESKEAKKEIVEAYNKTVALLTKVKQYRENGYSKEEIDELLKDLENLYQEYIEAYHASQEAYVVLKEIWFKIKSVFTKKLKK